jgi:peptidoglycan/LPS O-acetylase OafA/YrhL
MDAVNWTLSIEIKFYLLAALGLLAVFRSHLLWQIAFLAAAALGTLAFTQTPGLPSYFITLTMELNYIVFMVAGTNFYKHAAGMISTRSLVLRTLLILGTFCYTWSIGPQQDQFPAITIFYLSACAVFSLCYALRARFRPVRLLDFFADISYPLYCVHALVGYCAIKVGMGGFGLPFGAAVVLTLPCTVALAWLVHRTVETASNQLGKRLGAALSRRQQKHREVAAA